MSVSIFDVACIRYEQDLNQWIKQLKQEGFKALHPNDGWVDREKNIITLAYPSFDNDCKVGDKIMLGFLNDKSSHIPIKLLAFAKNILDIHNETKRFYFERINNGEKDECKF